MIADAHVMLEQYPEARDAYLLAMADSATMPTVDRVLVQMKFDDLPEIEVAEASPEETADPSTDEELSTNGDEAPE